MKRILVIFSFVVITLFGLSLFGWMVVQIETENKKFGFLTGTIKFMYSFPDLFKQSVEEVKGLPQTFIPTASDFEPVNKLEEDLFVLTSYSDTSDSRSIVLMNLKNDSVSYKWTVSNPYKDFARIKNPLLFPEKNLIYSYAGKELRRIDSLSNLLWKQDSIDAHHAMNLDAEGNIWVCSFAPVYHATGLYSLDDVSIFFKDNYITKIDPDSGQILFHKSITAIFKENGLEYYLLKSDNIKDPIHINDVEPALETTSQYLKDDLFLSFRNLSLVIQYRPLTNEIIKVIEGPFTSQHDVDILGDGTLAIFNNNYYTQGIQKGRKPPKDSTLLFNAGDFYSNIVRYDLEYDAFTFIGDSIFRANKIFTKTEGLQEFIDPETYFVEEQNTGELWVIRNNEVLYKNVFKSQHEGYHHLPNWTRIIDNYE